MKRRILELHEFTTDILSPRIDCKTGNIFGCWMVRIIFLGEKDEPIAGAYLSAN